LHFHLHDTAKWTSYSPHISA